MVAPIASRPFTCWSTGLRPIAQPPGSDTRASPVRASSGPSARIDARIVFTSSYGASGQSIRRASSVTAPGVRVSSVTPICASSLSIVSTSLSRGTLVSVRGSDDSSAAHRIGNAAFLAPDTTTSPLSACPPSINSLSMPAGVPLRGRQRLHRQRVHFLAHAIAQRRVDQLVPLDQRQALERRGNDHCFPVLAVAGHLDVAARQGGFDRMLDGLRSGHEISLVFSDAVSSRARASPARWPPRPRKTP